MTVSLQEWNGRKGQRTIYRTGNTGIFPCCDGAEKDRKASQIHSVALTNTPAINGMMPIVNSVKPPLQADTQLNEMQKKICRMLNLSEADFVNYGVRGDADG